MNIPEQTYKNLRAMGLPPEVQVRGIQPVRPGAGGAAGAPSSGAAHVNTGRPSALRRSRLGGDARSGPPSSAAAGYRSRDPGIPAVRAYRYNRLSRAQLVAFVGVGSEPNFSTRWLTESTR